MAPQLQKKSTISRHHLFNAGGIGIVLLGIGLAVRSHFEEKPKTPLCETRYTGGVLFSLARNGEPLIAEELQSRLGGLDRGLVKNARVIKEESVPFGYALEVDLNAQSDRDREPQTRSGIGFTWLPRQLSSATAACLSYSVWLPPGFNNGEGGALPGLVSDMPGDETFLGQVAPSRGAKEEGSGEPEKAPTFSTRLQWRGDGVLAAWQGATVGFRGLVPLDPHKASLRPGRWQRVEQEAVLNEPGKKNGKLRVWVDGKLVLERGDVGFRRDETQTFQGVVGDVHYLRHGIWAAAPSSTKLRISPLELRVR